MLFFWLIIPFFAFIMLVGGRHQREEMEEENGGLTHSNPMYDDEEWFEGEGDEEGNEMLTPLLKFVTKLGGVGGGEGKWWNL